MRRSSKLRGCYFFGGSGAFCGSGFLGGSGAAMPMTSRASGFGGFTMSPITASPFHSLGWTGAVTGFAACRVQAATLPHNASHIAAARAHARRSLRRKPTGQSRVRTVPSARRKKRTQTLPCLLRCSRSFASRRDIALRLCTCSLHEAQKRRRSSPCIWFQSAGHGEAIESPSRRLSFIGFFGRGRRNDLIALRFPQTPPRSHASPCAPCQRPIEGATANLHATLHLPTRWSAASEPRGSTMPHTAPDLWLLFSVGLGLLLLASVRRATRGLRRGRNTS